MKIEFKTPGNGSFICLTIASVLCIITWFIPEYYQAFTGLFAGLFIGAAIPVKRITRK